MASTNKNQSTKKPKTILSWIGQRKISVMIFGFFLYLLLGDANSIFTQISLHRTRMQMQSQKQELQDRIAKNEAYLKQLRENSSELVSPNFPILPYKAENEDLFIFVNLEENELASD